MQVGTAVARPGELTRGTLRLGEYPDAPIESPVLVAAGRRPGPTLWMQCCVHGAEVGGTVAALHVFRRLDLEQVSGTVVGVMVANPTAFRGYARNTPLDGVNLNRVFGTPESAAHFPGTPPEATASVAPAGRGVARSDAADSTFERPRRALSQMGHTEQTAFHLMEAAMAVADVVLDLHSGGDRSIVPFYALYWADGSPASREAERLARCAATPNIWATTDEWLRGAMFAVCTRRGKPGLIVECGGGAQVPPEHVENLSAAITGIMRAMKMLPGEPPRQPRYRVAGESTLVHSTRGGLFVPAAQAGDVVGEGQEVGRIIDLYGDVVEVVRSPFGPAWLAAMRRAYMPVYSGDIITEAVRMVEEW